MKPFSPTRKAALVTAALAGAGSVLGSLMDDEGGYRPKPYIDNVGVLTDCYGETEGVVLGRVRTEAQCRALLKQRAAQFGSGIATCMTREPPLESFRALIRFSYNVGTYGFCTSTVNKRISANDLAGACDAMLMWNKGKASNPKRDCIGPVDKKGKCAIRGLDNRRHEERAQCLEGLTSSPPA